MSHNFLRRYKSSKSPTIPSNNSTIMKISTLCLLAAIQATPASAQQLTNASKRLRSLQVEDGSFSLEAGEPEFMHAGSVVSSKAGKSKAGKSKAGECGMARVPTNEEDFGEPDWETILELAFPSWDAPENGCPRLTELGGALDPTYGPATDSEAGKFNPCYYTKAFAGLDPAHGGYPTPIDTHYPYEFAAPFLKQPGDGSVHNCNTDNPTIDIGSCPKLQNDCGPDCATISDDYGIGHIPPFGE